MRIIFNFYSHGVIFGLFFSVCLGGVVGLNFEDQQGRLPSRKEAPYVLGVCTSGTLAHFLVNYSAKLLPATVAGLIRSSDIFYAYLLEMLVLGEHPQQLTWLGATFICSSLVLVLVLLSPNDKVCNKMECHWRHHARGN